MLEELNQIALLLRVQLLELLPRVLMALLVLVVGYFVARFTKFLVIKLIRYVSQVANRRLGQMHLDRSSSVIGVVVFWFVMLITLLVMSDILRFTLITTGIKSLLEYSPNIIAACLIVLIAYIAGKFLSNLIASLSTKVGVSYGQTLGRIVQYGIVFIAITIAIDQIGIEIDFLINLIDIVLAALLFGAALAFGLGARTAISNILAAFYVRKMYKEGDEIRIGDVQGTITKIEATAVVLETELGQCSIPAKEFNERTSLLLKKTKP